jgi:hypothetical protein
MLFSSSWYFLSLRCKYFSQYFIRKHLYWFCDIFSFTGGDSIKVDESLFQDLEDLDLDADEALDDDSS